LLKAPRCWDVDPPFTDTHGLFILIPRAQTAGHNSSVHLENPRLKLPPNNHPQQ